MHFSSEPICPPHTTGNISHCSTLIELPDGTLLAAWMTGAYEPAPDLHLVTARRPFGAARWDAPIALTQTDGRPEGQPVFLLDAAGTLWLYHVCLDGANWTTAHLFRRRSMDLGRTWEPSEQFFTNAGWMLRSRPLHLGGGRWVLPAYDEAAWESFMLISDDDAATWTPGERIATPSGNIHACPVPLPDGSLLAYLRNGAKGGQIWRTRSVDAGCTWEEPCPTGIPNPNAGIDLLRLAGGGLVLAYNDSPIKRTPLCLALSDNDGGTWPSHRTLELQTGEYSYPTLLQTMDGMIRLVYTWRREYIRYTEFDEEWLRAGRI